MNRNLESEETQSFFYPTARSLKAVKTLLNEVDSAVEDDGHVQFQKQLQKRALKAEDLYAAGKGSCFAALDTEDPTVDYLTEKIPALIICAAFIIAGFLGGFLPQAVLVAILILVGSYFSQGVDSEHLTSEGNRLVDQLESAANSISKSMKKHKTNEQRQKYLHTLLYMVEGAKKEIEADARNRASK